MKKHDMGKLTDAAELRHRAEAQLLVKVFSARVQDAQYLHGFWFDAIDDEGGTCG